jgi:hypothetical protein
VLVQKIAKCLVGQVIAAFNRPVADRTSINNLSIVHSHGVAFSDCCASAGRLSRQETARCKHVCEEQRHHHRSANEQNSVLIHRNSRWCLPMITPPLYLFPLVAAGTGFPSVIR